MLTDLKLVVVLFVADSKGFFFFFFFQAEDGIRDYKVTGVKTCALPICQDVAAEIIGSEWMPGVGRLHTGGEVDVVRRERHHMSTLGDQRRRRGDQSHQRD